MVGLFECNLRILTLSYPLKKIDLQRRALLSERKRKQKSKGESMHHGFMFLRMPSIGLEQASMDGFHHWSCLLQHTCHAMRLKAAARVPAPCDSLCPRPQPQRGSPACWSCLTSVEENPIPLVGGVALLSMLLRTSNGCSWPAATTSVFNRLDQAYCVARKDALSSCMSFQCFSISLL